MRLLSEVAFSVAILIGLGTGCSATQLSSEVKEQGTAGDVTQIAGGFSYFCAVDAGTVRCWTDGVPNAIANVPTGLHDVTQVTVGFAHACALEQGSVTCWGDNSVHQTEVPGDLINVTQISSNGGSTTCALADGAIRCWGDAAGTFANVPAGIDEISRIVLASDGGEACAVHNYHQPAEDHSIVGCWGPENLAGAPILEVGAQITVDDYKVCEISGGVLKCYDNFGRNIPNRLFSDTVTTISAGSGAICATYDNTDGSCWSAANRIDGQNHKMVADLGGVPQQFALLSGGGDTTDGICGLANGSVKCWKIEHNLELGDFFAVGPVTSPIGP